MITKKYVEIVKVGTGIILLGLFPPLFGQIVIDYTEIPHIPGTRWTKNIAYNRTVNLGSAGGPQTWNFTSQAMGNDSCTNVVVVVAQTPFKDSFPGANLCYANIDGADTAYLYMNLLPNYLIQFGIAGRDTTGNIYQKYNPPDTNNLPEHYNDSRHYNVTWTYYIDANTYYRYRKNGYEHINAYGTVIIPYDTFPCLRYILYDTLVQTLYYNNVPIYTDTTTRILHQFVAENYSGVVCVMSQPEETNPYFTNAAVLERLTYFYTGIEESKDNTYFNNQVVVHPNPFRQEIAFTLVQKTTAPVSLEIYDVQGQRVKTLKHNSGNKIMLVWDGKDENGKSVADGIYFYLMNSGSQKTTGKVIRIK